MKPACTVQPVHFPCSISTGLWDLEPISSSMSSLSLPGYGTYSCGIVDKSIIVFIIEYVPRKATMIRGTEGG